jgi:PST family polysaccharide transporter
LSDRDPQAPIVPLRRRVVRGVTVAVLREASGVVIGLAGVVLLTRWIGPSAYGTYAAGSILLLYLSTLSRWGLQIQLVRRATEPASEDYHVAFTLALALGGAAAIGGALVVPSLETWSRIPGLSAIAAVLLPALPGMLASQIPRGKIERRLAFQRIAAAETAAQLTFYAVALPAAWAGAGMWAPVAGLWAHLSVLWVWLFLESGYRPALRWRTRSVLGFLRQGLGISSSEWLWQARSLVNPLIVGHFLGTAAVAYVDLAVRVVDNLGFVKHAATRVGVPVMAQVQHTPQRLRNAVAEGTRWQVLVLGAALIGLTWVSPFAIPVLFGPAWEPVRIVLPFIALGSLSHAVINLRIAALYVQERYARVTVVHGLHLALLALTTVAAIPRLGLLGYGLGELAALLAFFVLIATTRRQLGLLGGRSIALGWLVLAVALFAPLVGWWAAIPLLLTMAHPATWRIVRDLLHQWWTAWVHQVEGGGDSPAAR